MPFLTEEEPARGVALDVVPGIRRIVARNPSVMTYHGTNTYLIDHAPGVTVLDPGPDNPAHVQDVLAAAGETAITRIVLTHTHADHQGAAAALQRAAGVPIYAYKTSAKKGFQPDVGLDDGELVGGMRAVFTPGHAPDHLCFAYQSRTAGKILFSGDHVMSWSSSIVNPPEGVMLDYYRALELLLRRDEALYLPGHGPPLPEPRVLTAELLRHRQYRETTILEEVRGRPCSVFALAAKLYAKTDPFLKIAAQRNVLAHLLKAQSEDLVIELTPDAGEMDFGGVRGPPGGDVSDEGGAHASMIQRDARRRFQLR